LYDLLGAEEVVKSTSAKRSSTSYVACVYMRERKGKKKKESWLPSVGMKNSAWFVWRFLKFGVFFVVMRLVLLLLSYMAWCCECDMRVYLI